MKIAIPRRLRLPLIAAAAGLATIGLAGGVALAATSAAPAFAPNKLCYNASGGVLAVFSTCPAKYKTYTGSVGPKGATGAAGATGKTGAQGVQGVQGKQGPQGVQGPAGVGLPTITAGTTVSNWPESSGWANDDFTRTLNVTVQHAAPVSACGGGVAQCWFVTGTLTDNGTFTTVDGAASPNGSSSDKIKGALTGTMEGTADFELYASSDSLTGTVPVSASGSAKPASTTDWAELAFPGGTVFSKVSLTAYDWDYALPVVCGAPASTISQNWNDQITPGDDGQGSADGNITGLTAC